MFSRPLVFFFFFFNDTATTEIYTLSLHDALPIYAGIFPSPLQQFRSEIEAGYVCTDAGRSNGNDSSSASHIDRKSTRLNSSHLGISYAVFCLKKKKKKQHKESLKCDNDEYAGQRV